jgi:hypothetical protein
VALESCGCDPERNPSGTYTAALKGEINKISESIILGDTIKLTLQWPDVLSTITPLGDTRTHAVNSLQSAWFAYRVFGLDTINRTVYGRDSTRIKEFLTEGREIFCNTCVSFTPYFSNNSKPYRCVLNIVPKVRGIFYIEIVPDPGAFKINDSFEGLFKVNFDVADKHHGLISPFITGWQQAAEQRDREGFGIYCFRVN